jgi:hypothetical protein
MNDREFNYSMKFFTLGIFVGGLVCVLVATAIDYVNSPSNREKEAIRQGKAAWVIKTNEFEYPIIKFQWK